MMTSRMFDKVAVVTGSNRGIGFAIIRELCQRKVGVVYVSARDPKRGAEAVEELRKDGYNPQFVQLDVTDRASVETFAKVLKEKHGGIDILINNAGVSTNNLYEVDYEDAKNVLNINYSSILIIQELVFPILKDNARVINISSDCGHISNLKNKNWIKRLTKEDITVEDVNAFVDWFLNGAKNKTLKPEDFTEMEILAYRISKIALVALTRIQQKQVGRGISVNALHPGFVKTDMTRGVGILTLEESGVAPAYLALDIDQSVKGKYFWFDKTEKDWTDTSLDLYCKFKTLASFY